VVSPPRAPGPNVVGEGDTHRLARVVRLIDHAIGAAESAEILDRVVLPENSVDLSRTGNEEGILRIRIGDSVESRRSGHRR